MKSGHGFVYVATGEGYRLEALKSAQSLKRCQPNAQICLVSDRAPEPDSVFDEVVIVEPESVTFSPLDKTLAVRCPYDRAVFLDTDTAIVGDLSELFDILNGFELALLPETKRGWDYELSDVPRPFAEFNTGVMVFRNDQRIAALFEQWRQVYRDLKANPGLINDQPSLRKVLFESDIRVAPLPSEYHFLGNTENYIMWDARLIHARGNLDAIAAQVNQRLGSRVYVPDVGTLQGFHGRRIWGMRLLRFVWSGMRLLFGQPTNSTKLNPGQWWLEEKRQVTVEQ